MMTAHELAAILLAGPDWPVCVDTEDGSVAAGQPDVRPVGSLCNAGFYDNDWQRVADQPYILIST